MYELMIGTDTTALQSVAEVADLGRHHHRHGGRRGYRKNVCLVTANHSLNGISILNVLNGYGGW